MKRNSIFGMQDLSKLKKQLITFTVHIPADLSFFMSATFYVKDLS